MEGFHLSLVQQGLLTENVLDAFHIKFLGFLRFMDTQNNAFHDASSERHFHGRSHGDLVVTFIGQTITDPSDLPAVTTLRRTSAV